MEDTPKLSRVEFYEQVWATPMTRLAGRYGLSDRGLAKLCARHKIPVPGRGYWRRKETGRAVKPKPLPAAETKLDEIRLTPVGLKFQTEAEEHPDVAKQLAYEESHPVTVSDRLNRPHELVARTQEQFRGRTPYSDGIIRPFRASLQMRVSPAQVPRALRFFDALLKACEERGFAVTVFDEYRTETRIRVHGEDVSIRLTEHSRRMNHVDTPSEKADRRRGHPWSIREYDWTPTGKFTFTIEGYTGGVRHRWSDSRRRSLESCLNEIIVAIVRISVSVLKPHRLEREQEHQRWLREERREQREQERLRALHDNLQAWSRNEELRSFLAAVEVSARRQLGKVKEGTSIHRWLEWTRNLAERTDPLDQFVEAISKGNWLAEPPDETDEDSEA